MPGETEALRDWHRLFGLILVDFFTDSPFTVEVERDLSQQQQLLDVVIVRRGPGQLAQRLPDGLEDLATHNLITFKSHREALDPWAMKELLGHYVAYRKLISTSPGQLQPEDQFRLYAVCARYPHNLAGQVPWQTLSTGVYDCRWGTDAVRVIVAGELPAETHNALLHLFGASRELLRFGRGVYRQRSERTSRVLRQLLEKYQGEEGVMPFTVEDFDAWYTIEHFARLTPQEQREALAKLSPEQRREVLKGLPAEERCEVLKALPVEERLAGLEVEEIERYLEQLDPRRATQQPKPRRKKKE